MPGLILLYENNKARHPLSISVTIWLESQQSIMIKIIIQETSKIKLTPASNPISFHNSTQKILQTHLKIQQLSTLDQPNIKRSNQISKPINTILKNQRSKINQDINSNQRMPTNALIFVHKNI